MKVMVIQFMLTMTLYFVAIDTFAQFAIEGSVIDNDGAIPGASVILLSADSVFQKGMATDVSGKFKLQNLGEGEYLISVSVIGYAQYFSQPVFVKDGDVVLTPVLLIAEALQLNEIVVNSMKDLVVNKPDGFVMHLENSATSSGNTILEVLQKSPGIIVDRQSNTIRVNGRSGVTVTINGKPMQMAPDALVQMLDGMNASGIKDIEVITSPGAASDAQGSGGVINLVTKENTDYGTNVLFGLVAGASWAETLGGNFTFARKTQHVTSLVEYSISRRHNLHEAETTESLMDNGFERSVSAYSHRENITLQHNFRAGLEWNFGKTRMNLGVTAYRRDWNLNADTDELNFAAADSTTITDIGIVERNLWQSVTASGGIQRKIRENGELRASFDYLFYHNDNPSRYHIASIFEQGNVTESSNIDLAKTTPIHFIVSRVDYTHSASASLKMEAGVKSVFSTLDNDVVVRRRVDEAWITDPDFTSSSVLNERIYAGYLSAKWRAQADLDLNAGLRFEFTSTNINSPVKDDRVVRNYGYLFPNFSARKRFAPEQDLHLSYGRRIVRPGYNDIAPFVFFWGVRSFSAGNTKLYPAVVDAVTAAYHLKQWNVSLHFSRSRNEIASIQPERDHHDNLIYRSQNLKYLKTIGITNTYTTSIFPWWTVQGNLTVQHQIAVATHLPVAYKKTLTGVNVTLMNKITLPREFSMEISALYQSRFISGISEYLPIGSLNAGIQKSFGKKGTLQLAMDDILYTNYWKIRTDVPGNNLRSSFVYDWHNQYLRLTYTRSLGKRISRGIQNEPAEEERGRVN